MHLQQWLNLQIKLNNNYNNYNANLIEINQRGKIRYFQSVIINNQNIYKSNNTQLNDMHNIYFLRFFQYYFIFFPTIEDYRFNIIELYKYGYFKDHRLSFSINNLDFDFGEYYLLDYFTLNDMAKVINLTYNSFFDFKEIIDALGNNIYKKDLPIINYMNQINYFLVQFIYSLYKICR